MRMIRISLEPWWLWLYVWALVLGIIFTFIAIHYRSEYLRKLRPIVPIESVWDLPRTLFFI